MKNFFQLCIFHVQLQNIGIGELMIKNLLMIHRLKILPPPPPLPSSIKLYANFTSVVEFTSGYVGRVCGPSPKIGINPPLTHKKLHCKEEPYWSSSW